MKELMTLEQFWLEHPSDVIQIMSPGGYVTLPPNRPLEELVAHAGVWGTEIPILWEELKDQIVERCNFNESDGNWYLLTAEPSMDNPPQTTIIEKSQRQLTETDICFSDEIMEMDNKLNFYMDTSFNVDQVFGTHVETSENDDWLNIYADYDMAQREVCGALEITLNHADGSSEEQIYPLNAQEKEILLKKMNDYCLEKESITLEAYCNNIQAESEYPTGQMTQQM
jgi:hypothetical protein